MTSHSRILSSRILFSLAALPLFLALPAYADGSFLLQLGTFETKAEADKKWAEVKTANGDVVGKLQGHVAEVMLPPDNTPTYRTQMGPVGSRKEAKTLCKSLEARNVTCFVVETAFAATDLSPEMAGDVASPAPSPAAPADYTPPSQPKAITPEEQISSAPVAPIEAAPAPAATTAAAPVVDAPAAPVEQKTKVRVARKEGGRFNPNDMKKSGFFRGTFNLNEQDAQESEETAAAKPAKEAVKEPVVIAKASDDDDKPGFFGRLFGKSEPKEAPKPATQVARDDNLRGNVQVSEAIRVPVTENAPDNSTTYVPVAASSDDDAAVDPIGNGAYWVQIGYFDNENAAHNFYVEMQGQMPQAFANTRVRITRPFASRNSRASLRMGIFSQASDVKAICGEAKSRGMRCTSIRDTGADSYNPPVKANVRNAVGTVKKRYPSPLEAVDIPAYNSTSSVAPAANSPTASYTPASVAASVDKPVVGGQWVYLGGFATAQSAWNHWKTLQGSITSLRDVKSAITGTVGRKNSEKYQLRAGPIVTDVDAENICKAVVNTGNSCSVVGAE
jgi:hypothetical protein